MQQSSFDDVNASLPNFEPPNYEPLSTIDITDEDIIEATSLLNTAKAPGPDLISPKFLKEGAAQIVSPLHKVFTLSLWAETNSVRLEIRKCNRNT